MTSVGAAALCDSVSESAPRRPGARMIGAVTALNPAAWWRGLGALTRSGSAGEGLSWALYDFANTIYSYAIVSYAIGLWAVDHLGAGPGQFWIGVATAVSVGINAAVSPVLGAMSDRTGRRLSYLLFFTAGCVIASAAIALLPSSGGGASVAFIGLGLFAVANFAYQAALIYYDATLPVVSRSTTRGRMSGIGVAVGYLGTIVIAGLILVLDSKASALTFLMAATLFGLFSIPIFLFLREPARTGARFQLGDALASWSQLGTTLRHASEIPGLLRFLVGRFFYTDPVNTVIVVMSVFAVEAVGLTKSEANLLLLTLTVVAVIASFLWGWTVERLGPKRTLMIVLGSWCVGLLIVAADLSLLAVVVGGIVVGSALGGVWTSDRVFMLRLSPPDRVGEFFGLYGLAGKFSAVTGPLLYGVIVNALLPTLGRDAYRVAVASLLLLMIVGFVIVRGVREPPDRLDEDEVASPLNPLDAPWSA